MGKFITNFATTTEFESAKSGLLEPYVSLTKDNEVVHYSAVADPYNGHDYVEIGNQKWATMNVGATNITESGLYFQWGDTQGYTVSQAGSGSGQKFFYWSDYKYCDGTSDNMTKYNTTDNKTTLDLVDDAARSNWGGSWKVPTVSDLETLLANTNSAWTNNYQSTNVKGVILTDKTDNTKKIFFPSSGGIYRGSLDMGLTNNNGTYWSGSLYVQGIMANSDILLFFDNNGTSTIRTDFSVRCYGRPIRAIIG